MKRTRIMLLKKRVRAYVSTSSKVTIIKFAELYVSNPEFTDLRRRYTDFYEYEFRIRFTYFMENKYDYDYKKPHVIVQLSIEVLIKRSYAFNEYLFLEIHESLENTS